ncbi:hypothetical protein LTR37_007663 [Vermiconidia calcicola]|uniref:Uncharacterized protein n=1 Tax=Vermiconidia calcicola TaxID=1690605 RepID=A0ACC3NCT1_9PEZI|nr:hypothetical protein LTR37_007663 [Vermiconidia calcicola]
MSENKDISTMDSSVAEDALEVTPGREAEKRGTGYDQRDMVRMGKRQETRATWEAQLSASFFVLLNGGTGGAVWIYVGTFVGFLAAIASMAEMASMAPTTGGQYHWVSELAPRSAQRILSYIVGWLCVLGWQVGNTAIAYLAGTIIQGLAALNNPGYAPKPWQGTLIIWAVLTFSILFNTFFASKLPLLEGTVLVLHICGFFAILIPLWVLGDRPKPASEVFLTFTNGGGWSSMGLSCLVGMLSPVFSFIGPDSAVHMSEELRDASRTLPLAMMWTAVINGAMGFVMICTFVMVIGDLDTALGSPTGYAFISTFYNVTQSYAGASVMTSILIIMLLFGCVTNFATSSRQLWAFARDRGTPLSGWLSHVRPGWDIPINAVLFSYIFAMLLSLINLGSSVALNIVTSLGTGALTASYIVSISCIIIKRARNEPFLPRRWSLGRAGMPINIFSVLFLVL